MKNTRAVGGRGSGIDGYRHLAALLVELPKARTVEDFEALPPWQLVPAQT